MSVKKLQSTSLNTTSCKPHSGTEGPNIAHVFVGGEAFSLSSIVMIPYSGNILPDKKNYIIIDYHELGGMWRERLAFSQTNGTFFTRP
ncbi:hypothetical protein PR048_009395 [Dryococelus australis]|uniref:Uncharacterized protein n=1 Tax=Dryococelus australis TaxID=614101 RepID=A0ABQ9HZU3_9NEOP|nr:hypothetical protein PR048_009395 [Dryococelus australis]